MGHKPNSNPPKQDEVAIRMLLIYVLMAGSPNLLNPGTAGRQYFDPDNALIVPVVDIVSTAMFSIHCRSSIFQLLTCDIFFLILTNELKEDEIRIRSGISPPGRDHLASSAPPNYIR